MANPESVEFLNQARYFVGAEKYDDALEYINKAIAIDKLNKELYVQDVLFQKEADEHSHSVGSGRIPSSLRFLLDILY